MPKIAITVSLYVQKTIEASSEEAYEKKRDKFILKLEHQGCSVSMEDENDDNDDDADWEDG